MINKLLTEHHLEFVSLKGGCRGTSESTVVKMPLCWKSHAVAYKMLVLITYVSIEGPDKNAHIPSRVIDEGPGQKTIKLRNIK